MAGTNGQRGCHTPLQLFLNGKKQARDQRALTEESDEGYGRNLGFSSKSSGSCLHDDQRNTLACSRLAGLALRRHSACR